MQQNPQRKWLDFEPLPVGIKTYGKYLEFKREMHGFSQPEFANLIGIGLRTLQSYENGEVKNLPSDRIRNSCAEMLHCDQVRDVPPIIETAASLRKRRQYEIVALKAFAKHRTQRQRDQLKCWEDDYHRAKENHDGPAMREIDFNMHRLYWYFYPDTWMRERMLWRLKARIDYTGIYAVRLGILDSKSRAVHGEVHENLLYYGYV